MSVWCDEHGLREAEEFKGAKPLPEEERIPDGTIQVTAVLDCGDSVRIVTRQHLLKGATLS